MTYITVTISRTAGSAPRNTGTQMRVFADKIEGTIGGGALEWEAMAHARNMLAAGHTSDKQTIPLGPNLGQCCGGSVMLSYQANAVAQTAPHRNIWIYGAGHVGQALVHALSPLPDVAITWIDGRDDIFPATLPINVTTLPAKAPENAAQLAPNGAEHLIVTHSHATDLAICHALLSHTCNSIGLIGSTTKWARFKSRLAALGHTQSDIAQIACPIGDPSLGKHPAQIAIGVATAILAPSYVRQKDQTA
ncbi:MAG: xanthine dehydrogenase accessory protein XdhC [Yoonia sp.]|nr:xanthine dehydrogenase accessory protein XdhC [Yoonia sp.]